MYVSCHMSQTVSFLITSLTSTVHSFSPDDVTGGADKSSADQPPRHTGGCGQEGIFPAETGERPDERRGDETPDR